MEDDTMPIQRRDHWTTRPWAFVLGIVVLLCLAFLIFFAWFSWRWQELRTESNKLHGSLETLKLRCPEDVPKHQWNRAIDWTRNLIAQVFFGPQTDEIAGLKVLNLQMAERIKEPVDLTTLQWVWDQIESCDERKGKLSCAARFRDLKLMTKGPITDESLPHLWALNRVIMLDLSGTQISDASIPTLSQLSNLHWVDVTGTAMSRDGVAQLQGELPKVKVRFMDASEIEEARRSYARSLARPRPPSPQLESQNQNPSGRTNP